MSTGWSIFIIVIVALNIVGCLWLLRWTSKYRSYDSDPEKTTGHVWDGDLTEYNKPLPKWWINLFYGTIVFALGYLVYYPGLGNFTGTDGWSSKIQHDQEQAQADEKFASAFSRFADMPIDQIAQDYDALTVGRNLFANNCAQCHGSDARGAKGFPNLTDANWQWGNDHPSILTTIRNGRTAVMPPLAATLGDSESMVTAVATYTQSLSGMQVDAGLAALGKAKFEVICSACHGVDGKGNPVLGAPDLTDNIWVYGRDIASIKFAIHQGRNGAMPAFAPILGDLRTRLLAGYVLSLQEKPKEAGNSD